LWAAESPQDPVKIRTICDRRHTGIAPRSAAAARVPVAESLARTTAMKACAFRSTGPGCGCSGARCALRGHAVVNHIECFACVETYDLRPPAMS
jgi:hypothetical protein